MNIYDPRDITADGRPQNVFTFPFVTIEELLILDNNRLLVINDNNYPGSAGREFGVPDNNEFIVIHTAPMLSDEECHDPDGESHYDHNKDARGNHGKHRGCRPAKD